MIGYYLKHIDNFSKHDGDKIESYVLNKASKIIATSKWMRDSVINDYHQPAEKICSIQFGANIDEKHIKYKKFEKRPTLDLLFIGVDWKRKGGKIAIEAAQWLNDNGVPTTLHIIGGRDIDNASLATKNIDYIAHCNSHTFFYILFPCH